MPLSMRRQPIARRTWDYLQTDVDTKACNYVSVYACFLTGMTGCLSFSACFVWYVFPRSELSLSLRRCGFQTFARPFLHFRCLIRLV